MCIVSNMLFPSLKTQLCSLSFVKFTQTKLGSSEPHRNAACDSLSFVVYFVTYTIYDGNTKIHRERLSVRRLRSLSDSLRQTYALATRMFRYVPHFVMYVQSDGFGAREKLQYTIFYFCKIKFSQSLSVFAVGSAFLHSSDTIFSFVIFF